MPMTETIGSPLLWSSFIVFILAMLALDLGVFHRKAHEVSFREALMWSVIWVALALVLVFVALKMLVSDFYKLPIHVSLAVVIALLGGATVASLLLPGGRGQATPESGGPTTTGARER